MKGDGSRAGVGGNGAWTDRLGDGRPAEDGTAGLKYCSPARPAGRRQLGLVVRVGSGATITDDRASQHARGRTSRDGPQPERPAVPRARSAFQTPSSTGCTLTRRQPLIAAYKKVISSTTLRGSACQNHSLSSVMKSSLSSDLSLPHVLDHRTGRPDDAASALDFVVQTEGASKRRPRR
jgi:hypothetical protein